MKIEKQVCSLELAKKLKELGVEQESLFYWWGNREKTEIIIAYRGDLWEWSIPIGVKENGYCSAFTVAELGDMLPSEIGGKFRLFIHKHHYKERGYGVAYHAKRRAYGRMRGHFQGGSIEIKNVRIIEKPTSSMKEGK